MARPRARHFVAACLCGVVPAGCGTTSQGGAAPQDRFTTNAVNFGGALNFATPVSSLIGRRFETVVRQQYDFSCGSAALATLLSFHYDDPRSEQQVFLGMWEGGDRALIRKQGFSLLDMKRYLAARGLPADGYKITVEQVARAGVPGIALIDFNGYKHFVVVKGIDDGTVLIGDPSLGLRRESVRTFQRQWNGVFFVINTRADTGKRHFNQASDVVRAPNGRLFGEADPLGATALALTRTVTIGPALIEF